MSDDSLPLSEVRDFFAQLVAQFDAEDAGKKAEQEASRLRFAAEERARRSAARENSLTRLGFSSLGEFAMANAGLCTQSPIEWKMAEELIRHGGDVVASAYGEIATFATGAVLSAQLPIGPYTLDLAIERGGRTIAIECDGREFHDRTPAQADHDRRRDRYVAARKIQTLRFSGSEINRDAARCAREVWSIVNGADR